MAANSKNTREIANLGKRVVNQIFTRDPTHSVIRSTTARRAAHTSSYDKNLDDQVRPTVVPDESIQLQSEKYWAPHPQTGVFGPATVAEREATQERGVNSSAEKDHNNDPVLEEKAWFRPTSLEDLEKPHHQ